MRLSIDHKMQVSDTSSSKVLTLPQYLLEDIFNRLENASYISRASCVCKSFWEAGRRVQSVRLICSSKYHEDARAETSSNPHFRDPVRRSLGDGKGESSTSIAQVTQGQQLARPSISSDEEGSQSGDEKSLLVFRDVIVEFLKERHHLQQLRIEIEAKLQSKSVSEGERKRTDFWLSDPYHVIRWMPSVKETLQHLCIVDYGQQAIMRRTIILKILSQNCKALKTLDLRNMFIDSSGLEDMPTMTSFTMRCVKVTGDTLQHINACMRNLTTLALLGVFGVTRGVLNFPDMKVLCLGLSTMAKDISLILPSLVKLQLKMLCPEKLTINATNLKFMAFNLDVRDVATVELKSLHKLQELLYGAASFDTLSELVMSNLSLNKLFLDIPCMALGEDGKWLGVLKNVPFKLPSFNNLLLCEELGVLNIGPGLWHSMEVNLEELATVEKWPPFKRLILHMIPQNLETCVAILHILIKPTLASLEIYVHTNSPVSCETIVSLVTEIVLPFNRDFAFKPQHWTKSLDFSCFTF